MKKIRNNKIRSKIKNIVLAIVISGFTLLQSAAYSQPMPGGGDLGAGDDGVVGSADLTTNIGFMLFLALAYVINKYAIKALKDIKVLDI